MPDPIIIIVLVFAAYRTTRFFVKDSLFGFGPDSGSAMSVRVDHFAYNTEDGSDRSWLRGKIGDLLTCTWCLGAHISWIIVCLWLRLYPWELGIDGWILAIAVMGGQGYMNTRMNA